MPPKRNVEQPKLSTTPVESTVSYHDDPDEDCTGLMVFTGDNFPIWEINSKYIYDLESYFSVLRMTCRKTLTTLLDKKLTARATFS